MRWESDNGYSPVPTAKVWGARKDYSFGGRPFLDGSSEIRGSFIYASEDNLMHYGIKGQTHGIRRFQNEDGSLTREGRIRYGKNSIKSFVSSKISDYKKQRKAEQLKNFEEGRRRGQRAASRSYFVKNKVAKILSEKQRREDSQKGSFIDRKIDSGFDKVVSKTGLEDTILGMGFNKEMVDMAKSAGKNAIKAFKDKKIDDLKQWAVSDEGRAKLEKASDFVQRSSSKAFKVAQKAAPHIKSGLQKSARAMVKGGSEAAKATSKAASKAIYAGRKWLHSGNPSRYERAKHATSDFIKTAAKTLSNSPKVIKKTAEYAHVGAKATHKTLNDLLTKRPRRRV